MKLRTINLSDRHSLLSLLSLLTVMLLILSACSQGSNHATELSQLTTWEQVVEQGSGKEVTILMWGGNEGINRYMDTFVADHMKETYDVTLNRVPMGASDYLSKLINEKKNNVDVGTGDVVWINAENFRTAKDGGLLDGPFTHLLPNLDAYYDGASADLSYDSGIPIEGYEAIWGKAQLVLTYDSAVTPNPPKNFAELSDWVMENPGQFTFPRIPDDFVGTAFLRTAFYELTGERDAFQEDMTYEEFQTLSQPVYDYFNELAPYLWKEGKAYPATQAQQDDLFKNGEIQLTMGFEVGKTAGQVASGAYPDTVKTYVFDTGTIGNAHYLAVPYNAPEKAAALLLIDFLQSPEAQTEKGNPEVWGDMPSFDVNKISPEQQSKLAAFETVPGAITLAELNQHRLPEMRAQYIDWMKELWQENTVN